MNDHSPRGGRLRDIAALALATAALPSTTWLSPVTAAPTGTATCAADGGGLKLSPGFCATIFADNIGHARHMAVAPDGTVYVNTWTGRYYHNDKAPMGGLVVVLRDRDGDGRADVVKRFGGKFENGAAGGTGIALYKNALFVEEKDRIERYALGGDGMPVGKPDTVVSGMPLGADHPMHPFVIDAKGNLYVDMGSATNACQEKNRMPMQPGLQPCRELETRGGIWRYDANKTGQAFSPAERYSTGIRNGEGLAFDAAGNLYSTQHGRDQLAENWPQFYKPAQGAALPAEEVFRLSQGADFGWPECYYDGDQKKKMLAPEYGGDGKKTGACEKKGQPAAFFPAHWAPNDLLITNSPKLPAPYRDGLFIAFHGSWNRAPSPQGGYNVVYQPMANGKVSGGYVVFADGFAGKVQEPGRAAHRPSGLAVGPDGAIYISDDVKGRIWRVTVKPGGEPTIAAAPPASTQSGRAADASPPEGTHPDAGAGLQKAALPVPQGATADQVALGDRIFHGEAANGTCGGCHGSDAKGSPIGPDLTSGKWVWSDGSLKGITRTVTNGVPAPKNFQGAMPPMGGGQLTEKDVAAVAAYVWSVGHPSTAK